MNILLSLIPDLIWQVIKYLSASDIAVLIRAIGFEFTERDKKKYLNPLRDIFEDVDMAVSQIQECYRFYLVGNDLELLRRRITNPRKYDHEVGFDKQLNILAISAIEVEDAVGITTNMLDHPSDFGWHEWLDGAPSTRFPPAVGCWTEYDSKSNYGFKMTNTKGTKICVRGRGEKIKVERQSSGRPLPFSLYVPHDDFWNIFTFDAGKINTAIIDVMGEPELLHNIHVPLRASIDTIKPREHMRFHSGSGRYETSVRIDQVFDGGQLPTPPPNLVYTDWRWYLFLSSTTPAERTQIIR